MKPAFGVATDELDLCMPNGVIPYGPRFDRLLETGRKFIAQAYPYYIIYCIIILYIIILYRSREPRFDRLLETGRKFIAQARAHIQIVLYIILLYYI